LQADLKTRPGACFKRFAGAWLDGKEKTTAPATSRAYRDAVKITTGILGTKADGPMRHITITDMEMVQAGNGGDVLQIPLRPESLAWLAGHKSDEVHAGYAHHDKALDRAVASLPSL